MREWINCLARGIIDSGIPELVLASNQLETVVPVGEVVRGEIVVSSANNLHIKRLVYSSHERVQAANNAFGGLRNRIVYEVNSRYTEHGDVIEGFFYLVINAGEREIPYSLCVQAGNAGDVYGALATPRDFGLLAKRDLESALRMFKYQDFTEAPFMKDARVCTVYEGLKGGAGRRNLLEELLVALHVKEPVKLTLDTRGRVYENPLEPVGDFIDITSSGWGYVSAEIDADVPFIELVNRRITDWDFVNGRCRVHYRIVPSRLHKGRNFGRIRIRSPREDFIIETEAEGDTTVNITGRDLKGGGTDRESLLRHLSLRLDYETGIYESALILNQMTKEAERLCAGFPDDERTRLLQAELLILSGKMDSASMVLNEARGSVLRRYEERVDIYCFYQYLHLQVKPDREQKDSPARYIRKLLWEDGVVRPYLSLLLIRLDETMAQNPLKLHEPTASLSENGCSSPFLYTAACRLLEEHPDLLVHLGNLEIQVLYLGIQKGMVDRQTVVKAAGMVLGIKHCRKLVECPMAKLYDAYPQVCLLEVVCSILIKEERKSGEAFLWYEKALQQGMNLTRLYEYLPYPLSGDYGHLLSKEVSLYFSYDKDPDSHSRSVLYGSILLYMNPVLELYQTYTRHMEQFAMEQLFCSKINSRMAVIYEHMIYRDMTNVQAARVLPEILKSCRTRCDDPRMKHVIVRYEELEEGEAYLLEDQAVYVPLFSDRNALLFQDSYGNRYLDVKHWKVPAMDKPESLGQCYKAYPGHPMLRLRECRNILDRGMETDRHTEFLEETMVQMGLSSVFESAILQAMTDYYCERAVGDREGTGGFSYTYLVQLDRKRLGVKQRQQICETLTSQNYMREAYDMIREYGSQYTSPNRLMKLCAKTILMCLFDQDDLLLHMAYQVPRPGAYDSVIMDYLCEYFNGTGSWTHEVLIQGVKEHVETYDLEEHLLCQMLLTDNCGQMDSVFELYVKRKATREIIVKAYFAQKSVQYFLEGREMGQRVSEYLEHAVVGIIEKDRTLTIYLLALTRYFSVLDRIDEEDTALCRSMVSALLEESLVLLHTRELSRHILIPEDIMDKVMVEYRGKKDGHPELQVGISPKETDWHGEDFRRVYQGIYVKQKVLFEGEIMKYRIHDYVDGKRILAAEGQVEYSHKPEGKENSRFTCLNEMGTALKERDNSRLSDAMGDYLKKSAALGRLFPTE